MNNKEIKKELDLSGLTSQFIDGIIVKEDYYVFPGTTVTICLLHLRNGFTVVGESTCASAENFKYNIELGKRIAKENARNKIWLLEGYAVVERLYQRGL
jgi:hypothetical protein